MIKLPNAKLLMVVVGVAVLGIGLVVLLRRTTGHPEPLPELPAVEIAPVVPQPGLVSYSLRASLPGVKTLPVYKYGYTCPDSVCKARPLEWARALGFGGEPEAIEDALEGTLLLWSREGQTLVVNKDGTSLSYSVDLKADPTTLSGSFLPTFEQAASIVERTLTELGATSGLLAQDLAKNQALKTGVSLVQETTLAEAELLEIHFTAKIDDQPLYLSNPPLADPVLAWVGRDGKLLRLEYHPVGAVGEKIADYPLKNQEEVLQALDNGEGFVVSSGLEGGEEIVSTTITKVTLGYLLPRPDATVIQPIFVLTGQARTRSGKTGAATIYLPAVRVEGQTR